VRELLVTARVRRNPFALFNLQPNLQRWPPLVLSSGLAINSWDHFIDEPLSCFSFRSKITEHGNVEIGSIPAFGDGRSLILLNEISCLVKSKLLGYMAS
jgi:hypothetical protein